MRRKLRIIFGIILFLTGSMYFLYPNIQEWKTQRKVDKIIEDFKEGHGEANEKSKNTEKSGEEDENKKAAAEEADIEEDTQLDGVDKNTFSELWIEMKAYNERLITSGQIIADAWNYEQPPIDLFLLNYNKPAIGYIEVPDMDVRLPLYLGASDDNLANGAAVLSGTSMPIGGESTNCVIAAHRGWQGNTYFHYIDNMETGSLVFVTNPWETLTYVATDTKIIDPMEVESVMIQEGKDMVTLVSCHPYRIGGGSYRYLVFCERVESLEELSLSVDLDGKESEKQLRELKAMISKKNLFAAPDNLSEWESLLRIVLPLLTLVFSGIVISFRHIRFQKKGDKSLFGRNLK